jgi:hypothetical protein
MTANGQLLPIARVLWHRALVVLLGTALWIVALDFPESVKSGLDPSWHAVLVAAHLQDLQFGRDVIFTYGPWGWLLSHYYFPEAIAGKLVWELAGKLLLAAALVALTRQVPPIRRSVLLVAVIWFCGWFPDALFMLIITLAVLLWLFRRATPRWLLVLVVSALAFLAQTKFTFALLVAAGVLLSAASLMWQSAGLRGGALVLGSGAAYLGWWLAAGQNLTGLSDYWRYGWEVSSGYAQAMAVDERWSVFRTGAAVAVLAVVYLWRRVRVLPDRRFAWPATAFLSFAWFVNWKHGFVRADGHVFGFFLFSMFLALILPGLFELKRRWSWFDVCPLLCLVGLHFAAPGPFAASPHLVWERLVGNGRLLLHPSAAVERVKVEMDRERQNHARPSLTATVGAGTVDLLNYQQSDVFFSSVRYRPRPVFQSYSAYTPVLLARNLEFYRSALAPQFVVVRIETIDGRHPMQDDSLVLAELLPRYDLALEADDYVLFKAKTATWITDHASKQTLLEQPVKLGQTIRLPLVRDQALWLQVQLTPSFLGRLRGVLYKPATAYVVLTDDTGRERRYRIVPAVAEEGFIVQPLIESARDYAALARKRAGKWVVSIRLEAERSHEVEFWQRCAVRLSTMAHLPLLSVNR